MALVFSCISHSASQHESYWIEATVCLSALHDASDSRRCTFALRLQTYAVIIWPETLLVFAWCVCSSFTDSCNMWWVVDNIFDSASVPWENFLTPERMWSSSDVSEIRYSESLVRPSAFFGSFSLIDWCGFCGGWSMPAACPSPCQNPDALHTDLYRHSGSVRRQAWVAGLFVAMLRWGSFPRVSTALSTWIGNSQCFVKRTLSNAIATRRNLLRAFFFFLIALAVHGGFPEGFGAPEERLIWWLLHPCCHKALGMWAAVSELSRWAIPHEQA